MLFILKIKLRTQLFIINKYSFTFITAFSKNINVILALMWCGWVSVGSEHFKMYLLTTATRIQSWKFF